MITVLRALMDRQQTRTDEQCKDRDGNPKKDTKRNARDRNTL